MKFPQVFEYMVQVLRLPPTLVAQAIQNSHKVDKKLREYDLLQNQVYLL